VNLKIKMRWPICLPARHEKIIGEGLRYLQSPVESIGATASLHTNPTTLNLDFTATTRPILKKKYLF
jgi:hypothetical protein